MHKIEPFSKSFQNTTSNSDIICQSVPNVLYNFQNAKSFSQLTGMKITVVLETRHVKANGKFPVKIRFNFQNQAWYVPTGVEVPIQCFHLGKVTGLPKASMMNILIGQKLEYVQNVLEDLQIRGLIKTKFKTGTELKNFIESGEEGYDELNREDRMILHFKTYVENHLLQYSSKSSGEQYVCMLKKVETFCEVQNLFISDITVGWLKDFETFCEKTGMSVNGRGNYLRAIRTIFNDAIDRDYIGFDKYPFRRFKIKKAKTKHRNITVEDLRYMLHIDYDALLVELKATAKKHTSVFPDVQRYVDLFFLSFFLCGMNLKDLLFLRKGDIRNGQLSIMRIKTDEPIVIRVEPEAQQIIDRYPGQKYLLDFLDNYTTDDYKNVEKRMNTNLKHVLSFVTGYWGRHSWATIAGELDIPDPIIDIAQGRIPPGMAGTYIKRNIKKVSGANRKIIDHVLNKKPVENALS